MLLKGLLDDVRKIKSEVLDVWTIQHDILQQQQQIKEGMKTMSDAADAVKLKIAEIGNDVNEIDTDLQSVIDKVNDLSGGMTATEVAEVSSMLNDLKSRTRTTADKVPPTA